MTVLPAELLLNLRHATPADDVQHCPQPGAYRWQRVIQLSSQPGVCALIQAEQRI